MKHAWMIILLSLSLWAGDYDAAHNDTDIAPMPLGAIALGGVAGVNTKMVDPVFGSTIIRFTAKGSNPSFPWRTYSTGLGGSGDVPEMWNADSTLLLIHHTGGAYWPVKFDPVGLKNLGWLYKGFYSGPGMFSHSNPNLFYRFNGRLVQRFDYTNRSVAPKPTAVYDFTKCGVPPVIWKSMGGIGGNDSVFTEAFSTTGAQNTGVLIAAYLKAQAVCYLFNTATGVVKRYPGGAQVGTVGIGDRFTVHNIKAKGDQWLVISPGNCLSGEVTPCYPFAGDYFWKIGTTELQKPFKDGGGHWAAGCTHWLNASGNLQKYATRRAYTDPTNPETVWSVPAGPECGDPGQVKCTAPFDWHPAWLGDCADTGWAFSSTVKQSLGDILWPYQDEIVGLHTDGSNEVRRFSHHYSSFSNAVFETKWSIGQPSQDGRFYAVSSDGRGTFGCVNGRRTCTPDLKRGDVLIIKLR